MREGRLLGKTALVTGGASGIGLAIVRAFLREGARVAVLDREAEKLDAVRELGNLGLALTCGVANADDVDRAVALAADRLGLFDVLVNNAGVAVVGGLEEMSEADWDRNFAVNVKSIFLLSRRVIPMMRGKGGGSVVNIASETAFIGFPMHPAYCASKAAAVHLSRSMAARYAVDRIRVNALCPPARSTRRSTATSSPSRTTPKASTA